MTNFAWHVISKPSQLKSFGRSRNPFSKGVGDPNLFTVSQMPFFRGTISKKIVFLASFFNPLIKGFLAAGGKVGGGFWELRRLDLVIF